ncbi:hypothetical protein FQN60_002149, partial [Etheostoma spectabile]
MKLSRALSDLVKYTCSVGLYDIEAQDKCSWQVSSLSETKAHQVMQQKAAAFIRFNQRQLSRIYPSSYRDPLPGQMKKQLVLKIISGQQLPKPKDSMLGDRGEIIDPFVEVEVIGLPVDCCKEQTRVVDDNGYRHVYLEGMEEASIFVHVAVNDITGKARAATGIKGLFHRNPKQSSLDSHAAAQRSRKHPFGAHLLRRTASAPTKGQPKIKKGFPENVIDTKDYSSEGASEERESEDRDKASAATSHQPTPPQSRNSGSLASHQAKGPWERPDTNGAIHPEEGKGKSPLFAQRRPTTEPLKRASRLRLHDPLDAKPGVFARVALNSSGRVGMSSNCITCVIGSKESPEAERKGQVNKRRGCKSEIADEERQERSNPTSSTISQVQPHPVAKLQSLAAQTEAQHAPPFPESCVEAQVQCSPKALLKSIPFPRSKAKQTLGAQHIWLQHDASQRNARSCSVPRRCPLNTLKPAHSLTPDCRTNLRWRQATTPNYGSTFATLANGNAHEGLSLSDSSSCESFGSLSSSESPPMLPPCSVLDSRKRAVGTLQREMNALFAQKMEELRHKSMFFADCSTVQRPAPTLDSDNYRNAHVIRSVPAPENTPSSKHLSSTPLHSPSIAINAKSPLKAPSNGVVSSPSKVSGNPKKPPALSRTTSLPMTNPAEKTVPSQCRQDIQTNGGTHPFMEYTPNQRENQETVSKKKNDAAGLRSEPGVEPPAAPVSAGTPPVPAAHTGQARRALFSNLPSHAPVRRTKSLGHVLVAEASAGQAQSAVPEVCTDATMNDRLWSKLEPSRDHRDSMSSSSSISSSDTVIDLSLPNLARKSVSSLTTGGGACDPHWVNCRRSALVAYDALRVSKSKSIPNLQQSECPKDELKPRPLQPPSQDASVDSPSRLTQRRHTWSRLYMEGLKQSSASRPPPAAVTPTATASMSKSLGDLTSDDISCHFDSKYRSISRSFVVRPTREQLRRGSPQKSRPPSDLTEQLRKLTDVEPLTPSDFAQENRPNESQEEFADETLMRRTSSRSQSRVRYIANRAKKAQERQKLQSLAQGRSASFSLTGIVGSGSNASPIEERGNPEGACCVAQSPCTNLDLLGQLTPLGTPLPRQSHSSSDPENND